MQHAPWPRIRALQAFSYVRELLRDPTDTSQVFRLIEVLSGPGPKHLRGRFLASRAGGRLLERRPRLLDHLRDREALSAMPEGSLGRAYLAFLSRAELTPDGLVEASEASRAGRDVDDVTAWIGDRLRDSHDLWHVVTGYRDDLLGEAALLAFSWAQTGTHGVGLLAGVAFLRAGDPDGRRLIVDGLVRGLRAAWLPVVAWEELLAEDLEVVRARLRVGAPPHYEPFWPHELPPGGMLGHRLQA